MKRKAAIMDKSQHLEEIKSTAENCLYINLVDILKSKENLM